jgi:hypothetical protein
MGHDRLRKRGGMQNERCDSFLSLNRSANQFILSGMEATLVAVALEDWDVVRCQLSTVNAFFR